VPRPSRGPLALPVAVAAAVLAVLLTACGPVQPGAAAIIGSVSISVDTLQRVTNEVLDEPTAASTFGSDVAGLQRQILSRLISHRLLEAAARDEGVHVTGAQIDSRLTALEAQTGGRAALEQQAASSGIPASQLRSAVFDIALTDALADHLVADIPVNHARLEAAYKQNIDQFDKVTAAHILVKSRTQAVQILHQVRRNPSSFAALAKRFSIDTQSGANGGDLGTSPQSQFVPSFGRVAFKAKPGSYVLAHSRYGWHVIHVIAHEKTSLAAAAPQLRAQILQTEANNRLTVVFDRVAHELGIRVNPRYGKWDAQARAVGERGDDLSRPAHPTPTATPPPLGTGG